MFPDTWQDLKDQEKQSRRELIFQTAQKLLAEKDFCQVTVREIARTAGLSPGTLYLYYRNLDELLLAIFAAHTSTIARRIDQERQRASGCSIQQFCRMYIQYLNEHMSFYQMMAHFMISGTLSARAVERLNDIMRDLIGQIESIIRAADITQESRFIAHALFSALNGIMISYARYPGRPEADIQQYTLKLAGVIGESFTQTWARR